MKKKIPSIVSVAILTLVTTVFWFFFQTYRTFTKKPGEVVPEKVLTPLDPALNQNALELLQGRYYINEESIPNSLNIIVPPTPTTGPTITPAPTLSPVEESPSPTASPSAELSPSPSP